MLLKRKLLLDWYFKDQVSIDSWHCSGSDWEQIIRHFDESVPLYYNQLGQVFTENGIYIADITGSDFGN